MKMNQLRKIDYRLLKARIIVAILFLAPTIVLLFTYPPANNIRKNNNEFVAEKKNPFSDISILAKSAFVWDVNEQRAVYAKNEKESLPLASVSKVMTALVALDKMSGAARIKISTDSIKQEGDSGLKSGEEWRIKDLIDFSLVSSSNDGIYAVANAVESLKTESPDVNAASPAIALEIRSGEEMGRKNFIDLMNKKAKEIGLQQTYYLNETGLDASLKENGGYGSAEDMAKLFAYIIKNKPEVLEATAYDKVNFTSLGGLNYTALNTNEITGAIPNLMASKTGFTDMAGGNLVIAFDAGLMRPIVISVLSSTIDGRFEDVKKLVEATMEYVAEEHQ